MSTDVGIYATHPRTDVPDDGDDPDLIQPSDFTANHEVLGVVSMVADDVISVPALLADRALIATAPVDTSIWFAGATVRIATQLTGTEFHVRIWHEDDQTLVEVAPSGVQRQQMAIHRAAMWCSLVAEYLGDDYNYRAWAALTGMPSDAATSGGGSFWIATTPGTSGASEPDWAGAGATVTDGSVEWTRGGDVPDAGSIGVYVMYWKEPA